MSKRIKYHDIIISLEDLKALVSEVENLQPRDDGSTGVSVRQTFANNCRLEVIKQR